MLSVILSDIMASPRTWGLGEFLIAIIAIAACIAIVIVAVKGFGLAIPPWVIQIGWIVIIAVVAIFAIRLVLSM